MVVLPRRDYRSSAERAGIVEKNATQRRQRAEIASMKGPLGDGTGVV
jgi:hypothetical protein